MPISNTNVSMNSIANEKFPSALPPAMQNISLHGLSVDGVNDFQYVGGAYSDLTGSPNQSSPYGMGEFRGWSATSATTYDNTLAEEEYAPDSNVPASPQLRVRYKNGNIDVNWYGSTASEEPNSGTLVYQITNPATGYTVRNTYSATGDGPYNANYGSINSNGSAVNVVNDPAYQDWEQLYESGGGYDDEGTNSTTVTGALIFEKSGATTFTYSYTLQVDLENSGEGGL
ncbi:hypothetical protein N9J02_00400 [bacterium]|nr:hypothetical protein [bacterium]